MALFQSLNGSMRLLNNRLVIDSVKGSIGEESTLKFVGAIEHFFSQNKELKIAGHLSSDWLKISEMIISETTPRFYSLYHAKQHIGKHYNKYKRCFIREISHVKFPSQS